MPTYYNYAQRDVDSQINWATVGKDISTMLTDEVKIREDKKAAIDAASREFGKKLTAFPQGGADDANKWILNYSNDATQAILMQDRLLKQGLLSVRDYTLMRQNITDGTTQAFNLAKEYQDEYKVKMDRLNSNDPKTRAQRVEGVSMGYLEGFANFAESKILINPTDFKLSVGIMAKNKKTGVDELTDKVLTVSDMSRRLRQKFDYFDSKEASSTIATGIAPVIIETITEGSLTKSGQKTSVENAWNNDYVQKAVTQGIESYLTNPLNVSSVLTDDIGGYTPTFSEAEAKANPKMVLFAPDPSTGHLVPRLSPEQKKAATDYLTTEVRAKITNKESVDRFTSQAHDNADRAQRERIHNDNKTARENEYQLDVKKYNDSIKAGGEYRSYEKEYHDKIKSELKDTLIIAMSEEKGKPKLGALINKYGFMVEETDIGNYLKVSAPVFDDAGKIISGETKDITISLNEKDKKVKATEMAALISFMEANVPDNYKLQELFNMGLIGDKAGEEKAKAAAAKGSVRAEDHGK